jgi:hypothetical protein
VLATTGKNQPKFSVLQFAAATGAVELFQEIVQLANVASTNNQEEVTTYLLKRLVPDTLLEPVITDKANQTSKECADCVETNQNMSCLELIARDCDRIKIPQMMSVEPLKTFVKQFSRIRCWTYRLMLLLHVIYMSLLTYFVLPTCNLDRIHSTSEDTVAAEQTFVSFITWPVFLLLFYDIFYILTVLCSPNRKVLICHNGETNTPTEIISQSLKMMLNYSEVYFGILIFIWCHYLNSPVHSDGYHTYLILVRIIFVVGWWNSLEFLRGFKSAYTFALMLKIVICQMVPFAFLYVFILAGFAMSVQVYIQTEESLVSDNVTVDNTVYQSFIAMLSMGNIINLSFENDYAFSKTDLHLFRFLCVCYLCTCTVVLMNIIIAKINHTYDDVMDEIETLTWIENVNFVLWLATDKLFCLRTLCRKVCKNAMFLKQDGNYVIEIRSSKQENMRATKSGKQDDARLKKEIDNLKSTTYQLAENCKQILNQVQERTKITPPNKPNFARTARLITHLNKFRIVQAKKPESN